MLTRIFLLRHAESANPSIFHGAESDIDLSERGRLQAQAIANHLVTLSPEVLISSGMLRARATAEPIARLCNLPHLIEPDLHERKVGKMSGTATNLSEGPWPQTLTRWLAGETNYATEGAESFDDIRNRVVPIWERIAETHVGKRVVVVAHGVVCKVLLVSLLPGWGMQDWPRLGAIRNVAIHELVREPNSDWQALRINELPPGVS